MHSACEQPSVWHADIGILATGVAGAAHDCDYVCRVPKNAISPCSLAHVQGRIKSLYSIQRKMRRKGVPLEEVYDARALRVVIDDEEGKQQARFAVLTPPQTSRDGTCTHSE